MSACTAAQSSPASGREQETPHTSGSCGRHVPSRVSSSERWHPPQSPRRNRRFPVRRWRSEPLLMFRRFFRILCLVTNAPFRPWRQASCAIHPPDDGAFRLMTPPCRPTTAPVARYSAQIQAGDRLPGRPSSDAGDRDREKIPSAKMAGTDTMWHTIFEKTIGRRQRL